MVGGACLAGVARPGGGVARPGGGGALVDGLQGKAPVRGSARRLKDLPGARAGPGPGGRGLGPEEVQRTLRGARRRGPALGTCPGLAEAGPWRAGPAGGGPGAWAGAGTEGSRGGGAWPWWAGRSARGGRNTHSTARAEPFTVWDLGQRRVEAVQVVGGGAGVAAEQLPAVLAHAAELHVVVLLLLAAALLLLLLVVLRLPLDPFLLLLGESRQRPPGPRLLHRGPGPDARPPPRRLPTCCPERPARLCRGLTQCGQLHLPSGALSSSGSRQTRW